MESSEHWDPGTVYLRVTPKKGERPFVSEHRCWNRVRFIEHQNEAYRKVGGKIAVITKQEF